MKVSQYIPKLIDIDIQKITLLSLDEYKTVVTMPRMSMMVAPSTSSASM